MTTTTTASTTTPPITQTKLLINNEWVDAQEGGTFRTYNPATGTVIAEVPEAGPTDVDKAVRAARSAVELGPWSKMSPAERGRLIHRLADRVAEHSAELALLEAYNSGKLLRDAQGDLQLVVDTLRYYAGWADKIEGRTLPLRSNYFGYTLRQPVGVVGQIIPWNFPLLMLAWKWGPALACGNTIVMKPAEQTPLTALILGQMAIDVGFPPGVINLLNGRGEITGDALVKHPDVDKIAFTGHYETAKIIQRNAAETLKRCTFELGGKSPNVVFADADLDQAVAGAFLSIFFHCGQVCTAGSRLFVEKKIHPEFVERLAAAAKQRRLGDPLDAQTEHGPQVSHEQMEKILSYIDRGKTQGARLVAGGQRHGDQGYFIQPTIFDEVADHMDIARDEIFGPVVSVMAFEDAQEVIDRANNTHYGLAAGIWTNDLDRAHLFAKKVKAGTVWVNCYHVYDPVAPFGGFKMSGSGRENGEAALEHYTEIKTVTMKLR